MKISKEDHARVIETTLKSLSDVLLVKGAEYIRNDDPIHNFNTASQITGSHPARALDGFLMKHYVSYRDLLNDLEKGVDISPAMIEEKFNDILVYFLLQKSIFLNSKKNSTVVISEDILVPAIPEVFGVLLSKLDINPEIMSNTDLVSLCAELTEEESFSMTIPEFQDFSNSSDTDLSLYYIRFI